MSFITFGGDYQELQRIMCALCAPAHGAEGSSSGHLRFSICTSGTGVVDSVAAQALNTMLKAAK